jgi:hypothetical protein
VAFLSSSNNAVLSDNCQSLQNLTLTLAVSQDLVTVTDSGFSLQLNSYPQPGATAQDQTLNWFQYIIYVLDGQVWWEIQYWSLGGPGVWPTGYTPVPGTTPWLPAWPSDYYLTPFGSASSNRLPANSVLQIALTTDSNSNVTSVKFSLTDPSGNLSSDSFDIPENAQYPISGFQVDLVGPGSDKPCTFSSGAGEFTYAVSQGTLSVQSGGVGAACGQYPGATTGETSNAVYGPVVPSVGSTVSQSLTIAPMAMEFKLDKATFGQDEVAQNLSFAPAYWLAVSGFANKELGFRQTLDLTAQQSPFPEVSASVDPSLNLGLTPAQIEAISSNLPSLHVLGPLPVLAIDDTLELNFQTFMYPFTVSFPDDQVFDVLGPHQVAVVTVSASLVVQVPTGIDSSTHKVSTTQVAVSCRATIELAKGEDPYLVNLNPADPESYPSWLSFDLRLFKATPNQGYELFSVPSPADASQAVSYIQQVLEHLNNPGLITNGDTFDNVLTQNEDGSALEFYPVNDQGEPIFNFAVARVRIKSSITTTIGPVRVFFRLFSAASTVVNFTEAGAGQGTYRWGTDGSVGHKIALLGVQSSLSPAEYEYVTIPCFATERVNATGPADMKTQHDPPNALAITTAAGQEVDTYFGCWLDVNQLTPFLTPQPPLSTAQWDGPWTGTESLNGVISVAPHQCLVAEIRFDDTPIPGGATASTSDKLAQRNIAWLGGTP